MRTVRAAALGAAISAAAVAPLCAQEEEPAAMGAAIAPGPGPAASPTSPAADSPSAPAAAPLRLDIDRVRQGDSERLVLREGEVPAAERYAVAGTAWEEIFRFHDRGEAVATLGRLERGLPAERRTSGERLPPWVAANCRPQGNR